MNFDNIRWGIAGVCLIILALGLININRSIDEHNSQIQALQFENYQLRIELDKLTSTTLGMAHQVQCADDRSKIVLNAMKPPVVIRLEE
jgi:hypothetical protein